MTEKQEDAQKKGNDAGEQKRFVKFIGGCFLVVAGITMILLWFDDLAVILRGSIGFITALGGLLLLYSLKE
ncbi:MAG: hypothetical protein KC900_06405 [Candidatus Omnitrophica bacterium]|nr:hypothetical protein [Candidatus Omnitrophota bacterium]